jgi:hypothetical protein
MADCSDVLTQPASSTAYHRFDSGARCVTVSVSCGPSLVVRRAVHCSRVVQPPACVHEPKRDNSGELSGGHLQWTDGMLYPVLHRLERQGYVAAKWSAAESGRRRKYYRITKEGRAQLATHRQQWKTVDGTLRGLWMQACTV